MTAGGLFFESARSRTTLFTALPALTLLVAPTFSDRMASLPTAVHLSVRSLTKRYDARDILRGVSFEVPPGEIFALLGPNGAGKTTTLECILGLRRPDSGRILLGEIDAVVQPEAAKQLVGAQIQSASLQDQITPRQALRLFGSFYRHAAPVDALIDQFGLGEKADAPFASLSAGQKQRLFLALAFVNQPRVLLLDEPTVGLDPRSRRDLHQSIVQLRAAGCAVLFSTHDLDEAAQVCDRIGILDGGRIIAVGTAAELVARSRALPRLIVHTSRSLPATSLAEIPGAIAAQQDGPHCSLTTPDPNSAISALVKTLHRHGIDLLDLQVKRPSLEDVFLELTGRTYSPGHDTQEVST